MIYAILLSGGSGTRLGSDIPKQYIEVNKIPVFSYALNTLISHPKIDGIQVVSSVEWRDRIRECYERMLPCSPSKEMNFSDPGETRQLSIVNAIRDLRKTLSYDDYVIIHDAARPNLTGKLIDECIDVCTANIEVDGVLPVLPMKDTVYLSRTGDKIDSLLDRKSIFAGQAPEMFRFGKYLLANESLITTEEDGSISSESVIYAINGSTEPAIMSGLNVAMICGDEHNYKITTQADLQKFIDELE